MTLLQLIELSPTQHPKGIIHFGNVGLGNYNGPPASSALDIFVGKWGAPGEVGGEWLDTIDDARLLACIIRMAVKIAYALDPKDPAAALRLIPSLLGPEAFGGQDKQQKLIEWLSKCTP